jgi:phosphate acetyltransferase
MTTMKELITRMREKAQTTRRKVIVTEGWDERCLRASANILKDDVCDLILLGDPKKIAAEAEKFGVDISKAEIINPLTYDKRTGLMKELVALRKHKGLTEKQADDLLKDVNYFGCMLLHTGVADGLAGSAICPTAELMRPTLQIIKTKKGANLVSEVVISEDVKKKRILFFTDCSLNPDPSAEDLAQIAVNGGDCAKAFGFEPKVAFLSYSTKGSGGESEIIQKTKKAVELARKKQPNYLFEGEMQGDAAINPFGAERKCPDAAIKGDANVLVFPNLTAANIFCHLMMQLSDMTIGLSSGQGLRMPVAILGRSNSAESIENLIISCAMKVNADNEK